MKYLFSDFYFLCGAVDKETRTVGDAYRRMAELMVSPVSADCLGHALRSLTAGGYISISPEDGQITASTPVTVTDAGKKAAVVTGLQKLLGEAKAFNKNELKFCGLDLPAAIANEELTVDAESFSAITHDMMERRDIVFPLFQLTQTDEEILTLTVHHPSDNYSSHVPDEEDEADSIDPDETSYACSVSVTGPSDRIMQGIADLISAAHALLTEPSRTRKVALHGSDRSLIVTLARAASEVGTVLRMTVSQIRFNRQRFYSKRDSDLDYAQCGDPIILHEMNGSVGFAALLLPCTVAFPELLEATDLEKIGMIHQLLKR